MKAPTRNRLFPELTGLPIHSDPHQRLGIGVVDERLHFRCMLTVQPADFFERHDRSGHLTEVEPQQCFRVPCFRRVDMVARN